MTEDKNIVENTNSEIPVVIKKKRGRKPKKKTNSDVEEVKIPKKRGRKPKGGKIIEKTNKVVNENNILPNIILHLRCKKKYSETISEFNYNPTIETPESYNINNNNKLESLNYEIINKQIINEDQKMDYNYNDNDDNNSHNYDNNQNIQKINNNNNNNESSYKELWFKLKELQRNLHVNNTNNKKSACFWCTCNFDNPPIHIPKHFINEHYEVYGSFCSPECATSFLLNENIDSSIKFERYHLLNYIYGEIYGYSKNIKPAPNPYYLLDKYYGNLTINEYRCLTSNNSLLLVIDKPLTRVMPELHEDTNDNTSNNNNNNNNFSLKRNLNKKNKVNIVSENFGFNN